MSDTHDHYWRAVRLFGSESALARAIGQRQQTVYRWARRGPLPAECALAIERVTQGLVRRDQLRPDLWAPIHPPLHDAPFHAPSGAPAGGVPAQEN